MFFVILFIVAVVLGALYVGSSGDEIGDKISMGFLGVIVGSMFAILISLLTTVVVDSSAHREYQKASETKIIALQDNGSISGSFFLGSGNFNGTMKYVYMKNNNGEMKMGSVNADSASIIYSDQPKIESYELHYTNKVVQWLFISPAFESNIYKIYVPEGTVKQGFNIDLK